MPFQWLDVILVVVMFISAFLAMLRGVTREMLSIMSWALAAVVTLFVYPAYRETVRHYVHPNMLADGVLVGGVFIITLIVVSLITIRISDYILDSRVGALDRTLGFVFGLFRGLILVVIAFELYSLIVPKGSQPRWITEARSLPVIESTGNAIISLLPDNPSSIFRKDNGVEQQGMLNGRHERADGRELALVHNGAAGVVSRIKTSYLLHVRHDWA